jgi:secreted trypsin-like serine protease
MSWIERHKVWKLLLLLLLRVVFGLDEIGLDERSSYLRIVGGQDVVDSTSNQQDTRYGFFVSLVDRDHRHQCGGSLVAPDMVLTSSHCSRYVDGLPVSTVLF